MPHTKAGRDGTDLVACRVGQSGTAWRWGRGTATGAAPPAAAASTAAAAPCPRVRDHETHSTQCHTLVNQRCSDPFVCMAHAAQFDSLFEVSSADISTHCVAGWTSGIDVLQARQRLATCPDAAASTRLQAQKQLAACHAVAALGFPPTAASELTARCPLKVGPSASSWHSSFSLLLDFRNFHSVPIPTFSDCFQYVCLL